MQNQYSNIIMHSGTKGMKWGERNYQYEDGSLTPLGRLHYGVGEARKAYDNFTQARAKAHLKKEKETAKRIQVESAARVARIQAKRELAEAQQQDKIAKMNQKSALKTAKANAKKEAVDAQIAAKKAEAKLKNEKQDLANKVEEKKQQLEQERKVLNELGKTKAEMIANPNAKEIMKNIDKFDNDELDYVLKRMDLEQKLTRQIAEDKSALVRATNFVTKQATEIVKSEAPKIAKDAMYQAMSKSDKEEVRNLAYNVYFKANEKSDRKYTKYTEPVAETKSDTKSEKKSGGLFNKKKKDE